MILHHLPLDAGCRTVRLCLAEKALQFTLRTERPWLRNPAFLALNPAAEVPVLTHDAPDAPADGQTGALILCGARTICEYLDEIVEPGQLVGADPVARAETRRLADWFDGKFRREVGKNLVAEKIGKHVMEKGAPDSAAIRAGQRNIRIHLSYIEWLMQERNWLAGRRMSLADLTAAAHLSTVDYLGDVPWGEYPEARNWYARIKSRPSFKPLLEDRVPGMPPASDYADLDF